MAPSSIHDFDPQLPETSPHHIVDHSAHANVSRCRIEAEESDSAVAAIERTYKLDGFERVRHGCPIDGFVALVEPNSGATYWWATEHADALWQALVDPGQVIGTHAETAATVAMLDPDNEKLLVVRIDPGAAPAARMPAAFDVDVIDIPGHLVDGSNLPAVRSEHWPRLVSFLTVYVENAINWGAQLVLGPLPCDVANFEIVTATSSPDYRISVERSSDDEPFVETAFSRRALPVVATAMAEVAKTWTGSPLDTQIDFFSRYHRPAVLPE
jgi:hypothetical protein